MALRATLRRCVRVLSWIPVTILTLVVVWSYYAYVVQLCLSKYSGFVYIFPSMLLESPFLTRWITEKLFRSSEIWKANLQSNCLISLAVTLTGTGKKGERPPICCVTVWLLHFQFSIVIILILIHTANISLFTLCIWNVHQQCISWCSIFVLECSPGHFGGLYSPPQLHLHKR